MTQTLQTDVGILNLTRGRRERHTPTARVVEPAAGQAPAAGKGNLYILIELEGPEQGRSRLYREILDTIQSVYYDHREEAAAALTAALRAAHSNLQQYNQFHNTRFTGGATALAVTGGEIVSAQVGPTILAVRSQAGLQWFSPLNNPEVTPLGAIPSPTVEIGRVAGHAGIAVVAMSSPWANVLEVPLMLEATAVPRAQAVADQLAGIGIRATDDLAAVVLTLNQTPASAPPQSASARTVPPLPRPTEPPPAPELRPTPRPAPVATAEEEMWEEVNDEGLVMDDSQARGRTGSLGEVGGSLIAGLGAAARAIGRGLQGLWQRLLPQAGRSGARPASSRPIRRLPHVLMIMGGLAVLILAITLAMWYLQGRQRAQLRDQFLNGARINYDAGVATTDENQARLALRAATEQLDQAELLAPDYPEVIQLRALIADAQAKVNHIQPLLAGFDIPLITFDAATRQPRRVFVNGLSVYILDTRLGALERYQLDEATGDRLATDAQPQTLVQTGNTVGGRRVGELADAAWAPAAGNRTTTGALVIDRSNQLFSSIENLGPINVEMVSASETGFISGIQYYAGNLYLLDTGNSQIWRYRPTGDSYTAPPEPYFTPETSVNLSTVIDVTIDGAIWLLHPNGTVLKYFGGVQEAFALDVVEPPLGDAVAIWVNEADAPGGRVFIADANSNRILVFDKQGKLLSQLTPADHPGILSTLRSIAVDEAANTIYLLTGSALYQAPIPPIAGGS